MATGHKLHSIPSIELASSVAEEQTGPTVHTICATLEPAMKPHCGPPYQHVQMVLEELE